MERMVHLDPKVTQENLEKLVKKETEVPLDHEALKELKDLMLV